MKSHSSNNTLVDIDILKFFNKLKGKLIERDDINEFHNKKLALKKYRMSKGLK